MTEFSPTFYSPTLTGIVNITGSLAVIGDITVDANITANNFTVNNNFTAININATNVTATAALSGATLAIAGTITAPDLVATNSISGATLTVTGNANFSGGINAVNFIASNNVTTLSLISSGANFDALSVNDIISQPTFLNAGGAIFVGPVIANGGITAVGGTVSINADTNISGNLSATGFSSATVTANTVVVNGQLTVTGEIVNPAQLRTDRLISAQTAIQGRAPSFILSNIILAASEFDRCYYVVNAGGYSVQFPTVFEITTQYPFLIGGGGFDFWYANTTPGTLTVLSSINVSINNGGNVFASYIVPAGRTVFLRFQIAANALSARVFVVGACDSF